MLDEILSAFGMMSMGSGGYYGDPSAFPGIGMGGMVQNELAFSAMMDMQARQFCANWYEERQEWRRQNNYWGYLPGPVTTADLVRSNAELQGQYDRNNAAWHNQQASLCGAGGQPGTVGQFSEQAIRGYAPHQNSQTGEVVNLPYGPQAYRQDQYDRFHAVPENFEDHSGATFRAC